MKKLFAVLLALLLALSMVSALADGETGSTITAVSNGGTFTIDKTYNLVNADEDYVPAEEDLDLNISPDEGSMDGVSALYDSTSKEFTIQLPNYTAVGVHTYTITEKNIGTAGVSYDENTYKLTVTVANDTSDYSGFVCYPKLTVGETQNKVTAITNTYTAGDLTITKEVTGNMGDRTMDFTFKVLLTGATGVSSPAKLNVSGDADINEITVGQETEIKIRHGESFTIENLPAGMTYKVTEVSVDGYTTTVDGVEEPTNVIEGTMENVDVSRKFTNDNDNGSIDTGITTDSMPYIVLMGIVVLAGVAMIAKRRAANND